MTAPFSTVAPMPIRQSSSTVQPCSTAPWPTETPRPIVSGKPGVDVADHRVLDVRVPAEHDRLGLGAEHRVVPDAGAGLEADVADDDGTGGDEGALVRRRARPCRRW